MSGMCKVVNGEIYVPAASITDRRLASVKDTDRDSVISGSEAFDWVSDRYYAQVQKVFRQVYSQCGVFDKAAAIKKLQAVRTETMRDINLIERNFWGCGNPARDWSFESAAAISYFERISIDRSFTHAARKGVGQLGIFFLLKNGKISIVRPNSAGNKAGLMVNDQLISIDGIKFKESYEYFDHVLLRKDKAGTLGTWEKLLILRDRGRGKYKKSFGEAMYGKCGSVAKVVIERNGKRMTLKITRGVG